jgi:tryptophanyl-tRNA synthetase
VRIFSGIQPTGSKHLGNYIGAIRQYVEGQDRGAPAIYCIVDLHALTVPWEPATLRGSLYDTTAILLAAGLDPDRCVLFRQSDVHEHSELTWYLSALTAHGDLNRMTQFKEKSAKQRELVSAGLFFYPVLQAADVLAYKAGEVPVGEDQRQHVELMREIARRFNERFGPILVEPEHRIPEVGARIMDLQEPTKKMSTTGGNEAGTVLVLDDPKTVTKKVKSAVTDSGSEVKRGDGKEGIANLIEILAVARGTSEEEVEREFEGSGYGDFKGAVAEAVVEFLAPVRERYEKLRPDEEALERTLTAGAEKARGMAAETLAEVRSAIGVGPALR